MASGVGAITSGAGLVAQNVMDESKSNWSAGISGGISGLSSAISAYFISSATSNDIVDKVKKCSDALPEFQNENTQLAFSFGLDPEAMELLKLGQVAIDACKDINVKPFEDVQNQARNIGIPLAALGAIGGTVSLVAGAKGSGGGAVSNTGSGVTLASTGASAIISKKLGDELNSLSGQIAKCIAAFEEQRPDVGHWGI
jgi:hypothetical protein